jgi:hypothetical protein
MAACLTKAIHVRKGERQPNGDFQMRPSITRRAASACAGEGSSATLGTGDRANARIAGHT